MMSNSVDGVMGQQVLDKAIQDLGAKTIQRSQVDSISERQSVTRKQESDSVKNDGPLSSGPIDQLANLKALGNVKLSISIDETKQLPVIKIFDDETGKELIQIPAEHALNISRTIKAAVGAIFDTKA